MNNDKIPQDVVNQMATKWHVIVALVMQEAGVDAVRITMDSINQYASGERMAVVLDARESEVWVRLVTEKHANAMKAKHDRAVQKRRMQAP